jgi:hypothetical protein
MLIVSELDSVLKDILNIVAQKRSDGVYPPGLEEQLDAEFSHLLSHDELNTQNSLLNVKNMLLDRLAVVDHLAMMIIELEARLKVIETKLKPE